MNVINSTTKKMESLSVNDAGELLVSTGGGGGDPPATEATLDAILALTPTPVDTGGNPLPADFDTLPQTLVYAAHVIQSIAVTNGTNTWTQTYGYTGTDLTSISGWVKT